VWTHDVLLAEFLKYQKLSVGEPLSRANTPVFADGNHIMFAALGIVLLVAGAVITFAIDRQAEGVDLEAIGWILMAAGALSLLVSLFTSAAWWSSRTSRVHTERHASADGGTYVEDTRVG
jgi:heme/copper-type cytochrome/quinol oxidase subunit 2